MVDRGKFRILRGVGVTALRAFKCLKMMGHLQLRISKRELIEWGKFIMSRTDHQFRVLIAEFNV